MNKVVTVNLNGRTYEVDEAAYDALRRYLDSAEQKLADNPDKQEIISDLEQAIAEKCDLYRSAHKNVIVFADMEKILMAMGDVDGAQDEQQKSSEHVHAPKRLYRLREDRMLLGVCSGLAAYLNVDVTLIRVLFVILAFITHGGFAFGYLLIGIFIPEADTPEQKAQAYGAAMVTANDLIRRARESYEGFRNSEEWKKGAYQMSEELKKGAYETKAQVKEWKRQFKKDRRQRHAYSYQYQYRMSPLWEAVHSILGLVWFAVILYLGWLLYTHVPAAHNDINAVAIWLNQLLVHIGSWIAARVH
jgi:phage shock protein PspC (stress-responsive transcriptional regulator)